jgi:hypothetical protein
MAWAALARKVCNALWPEQSRSVFRKIFRQTDCLALDLDLCLLAQFRRLRGFNRAGYGREGFPWEIANAPLSLNAIGCADRRHYLALQ